MIIPSLGSGGAERQFVTLAIMFKKQGIDVECLLYHDDLFYINLLEDNLIKTYIIKPKNYLDRILKVRKFIIFNDYYAVISFLESADFLNTISAIGTRNWKCITTELSAKKTTFISFKGKIFSWFRRYSDIIVCNSHNSMKMWSEYYPSYYKKLCVIYNPVILPEISLDYVCKRNGKLNVVIAASYQYLKNPIGLVQALILMDEKTRNKIEIYWYGRKEVNPGDLRAYNEATTLINTNNLQEVIHLNDATKDIANKMYLADIVGLFSKLEGLPNAICEAMMIGKPIIMSKVSDYNLLVDESNGFLCDWNNPETIKHALEKAINLNTNELLSLGNNSRNKALKLFSPDNVVNQWMKILV